MSAAAPTALPRVAVIGAGASGIATGKVLHQRGIPFVGYEASDRVGGNWVFGNRNGMSSSYRSLHINTSRERMEFSDFPMPKSLPDFPRHDHIAAYFDDYVDHFGFRDAIRFETRVAAVRRRPDGVFEVTTEDGDTDEFDAVAVANGHHWDARMPEPAFPGSDTTKIAQMHSHDYKGEEQLAGKDVVVLGMGNSAMDIAVDASYHARTTYLAHRRGAHIVPKYLFGKPMDQLGGAEAVPARLRWPMIRALLRMTTGRMEDYGLQPPDHRFAEAHPTVSGRILDRLSHGAVTPKPNIARLHEDEVEFTDGTRVHADVVVYCTGYRISFPFLEGTDLDPRAGDNQVPLYKSLASPRVPGLWFIGLVQPLGAIMPIAERQSELLAAHLMGACPLPPEAEMRDDIARKQAAMAKRYVASKRHTIQVDFEDYMKELRLEREAGARRAAAGTPSQVVARARTAAAA